MGRKKGSYTQLERFLRIVDLLRLHYFGLTKQELAEEVGVTPRHLDRDLKELELYGYGITPHKADGCATRWRLQVDRLEPMVIAPGEHLVLQAVQQVFDVLRHTPLREDANSLVGKIAGGLEHEGRSKLHDTRARFVYLPDAGRKKYEGKLDVLDELWNGVVFNWRVEYRYEREGVDPREGRLEPYAMALYKQGLYVIGRDPARHDTPRVFAAERFTRAKAQKSERFEIPKDFDVHSFFDGAFGIFHGDERKEVVVEFAPRAKPYLESREWHPSQTLEPLEDGGLRFRMHVANTAQVLPWVLSWGPLARVLAPKELAEEVAEAVRGMAASLPEERPGLASTRPAEGSTGQEHG